MNEENLGDRLRESIRQDNEKTRGLREVRDRTFRAFSAKCNIVHVYVMPQGIGQFRAYIFFGTDSDVITHAEDGCFDEIVDFVYDELDRVGRGKRGEITVGFEWDSDENVKRSYQGNYYLRLH